MANTQVSVRFGGLIGLLLLALLIFVVWWFFSSLFSLTVGQLLLYAVVGLVCFAAGRMTR